MGEGKEEVYEDLGEYTVKIPDEYLVESTEHLINVTFPSLGSIEMESSELIDATIYTPLNINANLINEKCLNRLPGDERTYLSADKIMEDDQNEDFPTELLNTISVSGLPNHELKLKEGSPVILIRNLQGGQGFGLRNGTRMIVLKMMDKVIECKVAVGTQRDLRVFLPRIPMTDKSNELPFTIVRRQFPIKLAFCLTINKVRFIQYLMYFNISFFIPGARTEQ